MGKIHEKFSTALKARLNGKWPDAFGDGLCDTPARARQAEVAEEAILAALAESIGASFAEQLGEMPVSHEFLSAVPIGYARRHGLIGVSSGNGSMGVAIWDLGQMRQLQTLSRIFHKRIRPIFAPRNEILRTINAAYQQQSGQAQRLIEELDENDVLRQLDEAGGNEDLLDVAARAPVIRLVNLLLFEAVKRRASDVHVQPYEDKLVCRLRLDGVLHDVHRLPGSLHAEVISRIKVMGGMNIAEHRLAQDGRATVEVGDRVIDLRIATLPTSFGERAVIRLLDKSVRLYDLGELGMPAGVLESFRRLIRTDHGIILVTGPTGSGKSTTLYAVLQEINSKEMNILTLEDPIEYRLEGISQTQVSDRKGMTFVSGLRHVLRQDPDIIMIGEIRDSETAHMAIQSALTGHLVFSTLHTNDAAGAVARMLDLGAEPYLLASSLLGVLAQRLVRRICPRCRESFTPSEDELRRWGVSRENLSAGTIYRGAGCEACLDTGYRERIGIFEQLTVSEPIREQILHHARASTIKSEAVSRGMATLRADGLTKAAAGTTSMDEVARVTARDERSSQ